VLDGGRSPESWVMPAQDASILSENDPADLAAARESVRLAFVAALQHLPARQRAVLILREVLRLQATEVADLLDTTVASVNSALQRARATLEPIRADTIWPTRLDGDDAELVSRYVDAFERYDVGALVSLLHHDAIQSMPPFAMWLRGRDQIAEWYVGQGAGCEGARLIPTRVNGCPAFGNYRVDPAGGHAPFSIQVIEAAEGQICGLHSFLYPELFAEFGLPAHLD
jgi:RNA polymerase sigma-70 factor (ECF subfamily)